MRLQRALGYRSRDTQRISGEEAADVDLIIVARGQLVPTIARHKVPLGPKIVVHAPDCEVASSRQGDVGREAQFVGTFAFVQRTGRVRLGLILLPYLLNQGVDSNSTRVDACQGGHDASYGIGYVSCYQCRRGNEPIDGFGVGETEAFVIGKEVSLAPKNLFRDKRTTDRTAEAAVMETWQRNVVEVILPAVR